MISQHDDVTAIIAKVTMQLCSHMIEYLLLLVTLLVRPRHALIVALQTRLLLMGEVLLLQVEHLLTNVYYDNFSNHVGDLQNLWVSLEQNILIDE